MKCTATEIRLRIFWNLGSLNSSLVQKLHTGSQSNMQCLFKGQSRFFALWKLCLNRDWYQWLGGKGHSRRKMLSQSQFPKLRWTASWQEAHRLMASGSEQMLLVYISSLFHPSQPIWRGQTCEEGKCQLAAWSMYTLGRPLSHDVLFSFGSSGCQLGCYWSIS